MARLFFKKLNESIAQCSQPSLISLVFVVELVDLFTTYLNFLVRPEFFLRHELSPWIKAAFYYGKWDNLFVPWITLVAVIIISFLSLKYLKKGNFLNFVSVLIIIMFIGAALTNVCAIIFNSTVQGRIVFVLAETLFLIFLASIIIEQVEQFPYMVNKEYLERIKSLIDHYDFLRKTNGGA